MRERAALQDSALSATLSGLETTGLSRGMARPPMASRMSTMVDRQNRGTYPTLWLHTSNVTVHTTVTMRRSSADCQAGPDHVSQYTSWAFGKRLRDAGIPRLDRLGLPMAAGESRSTTGKASSTLVSLRGPSDPGSAQFRSQSVEAPTEAGACDLSACDDPVTEIGHVFAGASPTLRARSRQYRSQSPTRRSLS